MFQFPLQTLHKDFAEKVWSVDAEKNLYNFFRTGKTFSNNYESFGYYFSINRFSSLSKYLFPLKFLFIDVKLRINLYTFPRPLCFEIRESY